jgi:hypothetical protein
MSMVTLFSWSSWPMVFLTNGLPDQWSSWPMVFLTNRLPDQWSSWPITSQSIEVSEEKAHAVSTDPESPASYHSPCAYTPAWLNLYLFPFSLLFVLSPSAPSIFTWEQSLRVLGFSRNVTWLTWLTCQCQCVINNVTVSQCVTNNVNASH